MNSTRAHSKLIAKTEARLFYSQEKKKKRIDSTAQVVKIFCLAKEGGSDRMQIDHQKLH